MAKSEKGAVVPIRFPAELHERLRGEAEADGRSFAAEVRRRLEASFADKPPGADEKTRQLLGAIAAVAGVVGESHGLWYSDPVAFAVLRRAVDRLLFYLRPSGEPAAEERERIESSARVLTALALQDVAPELVARAVADAADDRKDER